MTQRIAMTAGLHGSASTWVFNVVRELALAAFGADRVFADYLEYPIPILSDREFVLIKSHYGSEALDRWMADRGARTIVSIRDPRDAAVSMMRRFGGSADAAAGWLANDCRRIVRLVDAGHLVLRYESRFFDDRGMVTRLAGRLGLPATETVVSAIFERYATEALRRSVLADTDPVTQIWPNHIGDTVSGKWRSLSTPEREALNRSLGQFARHLGYPEE